MPNGINIPTNWTEIKSLADSGWRLYHSKQIRGTRFNYAVYCTNDEPGGVSFNTSLKHESADLIDFETNYILLSNKPFVPSTVLDTTTNTFVPNTIQLQQTSVQSVVDPVTNTVIPLTPQQATTVSIAPNESGTFLKKYFLNLALDNEMAVNGLPTTKQNIWDGSGIGDVGTPDFSYSGTGTITEEILASHSGTNGLKIFLSHNKYIEFSGNIDLSFYNVLSFWINIQSGWESKGKLEIILNLSGNKQGKTINVRNYMTSENENIWQQVIIPISDFGNNIANIDRIKLEAHHHKYFYLDDFETSTNGSGLTDLTYSIFPTSSEKYLIDLLNITMVLKRRNIEALYFGNINTLTNGMDLKLYKNNLLIDSTNIKTNTDLLSISKQVKKIGNHKSYAISYDLKYDVVLDGSQNDKIDIIINDDLRKLISLNALTFGVKVDI